MKIAIHDSGKGSFSEHWISYCKKNNINYKIVNAYNTCIIQQIEDCDAFMWHHHHANYKDVLFAKQLLYSLQILGKKVFPDFNTTWHFDDKVGQKYLLESIGAPFVSSYVFYTKKEVLEWINKTTFPKVFKLRGGAGASNVKLVTSKNEAIPLIKKAFGKGFNQYDWRSRLKEAYRKYKLNKASLRDVLRVLYYAIKPSPTEFSKFNGNEKGYIYFQDFVPNNTFDIRVIVIENKAFAIKRMTREGDFRASGSGNIVYKKEEFDERCVKIAFEVNEKIKSQSIAYDFVFDANKNPLIVEISYGFVPSGYDRCEGYWDEELNWYQGPFNPYGWMVDMIL